ncbi:MAG: hypothetical protein ACRDJH_00845 [Thermomicrobiales bacterium]
MRRPPLPLRHRRWATLLLGAAVLSLAGLSGVAADDHAATTPVQTIEVNDTRIGDGPCGFPVQRDITGSVEVVPAIDERGNLVLTIDPVTLHGSLTNPANGSSTSVALALTGRLFRGYDVAPSGLALDLPADGAKRIAFEPGGWSSDPWARVCGLLS